MVKRLEWTPELVDRFWSGVAQTRLAELSFSRHNATRLIELIECHLQPEGRHLDFGSGEGDLVEALVARGYATAALEPVHRRADRMPLASLQHPKFLGYADSSTKQQFDVILMVEVIEHVLQPDLDQTLRFVRSLLAPRGTLIVTTPINEDLELASSLCPTCNTLFHRWQHQRSFTADSLESLLGRYGLECASVESFDFSSTRLVLEMVNRLHDAISQLRSRQADPLLEQLESIRSAVTGETQLVYVGRAVD